MTHTSVLARSKPYRPTSTTTYTCQRCGIIKIIHSTKRQTTHCIDCKPYANKDK